LSLLFAENAETVKILQDLIFLDIDNAVVYAWYMESIEKKQTGIWFDAQRLEKIEQIREMKSVNQSSAISLAIDHYYDFLLAQAARQAANREKLGLSAAVPEEGPIRDRPGTNQGPKWDRDRGEPTVDDLAALVERKKREVKIDD
jgi:hypothetical protein